MSTVEEFLKWADRGDLRKTEKLLRKLVKRKPDHPEAAVALARVLIGRRQLPEAIRLLTRAAERRGDDAGLLDTLARVHALRGRYSKAFSLMRRAHRADPKSFHILYRFAWTALRLDKHRRAKEAFETYLKWRPGAVGARIGHGLAASGLGHFDDALESLRVAADRFPNDRELAAHLGIATIYAGDLDEAEAMLRDAMAAFPSWVELQLRYIDLLMRQRRFEDAVVEAERAGSEFQDNPWGRFLYNMASYQVSLGEKAIAGMSEAAEALSHGDAPKFAPLNLGKVWTRIGLIHLGRNEPDEAATCFRRELESNPEAFRPHLMLGRAYYMGEEYDKASQYAAVATELNSEDSRALVLRGLCLVELGDAAGAEEVLRRAIEIDPDEAMCHVALSKALNSAGRAEEAEDALATAMRLKPNAPEIAAIRRDIEAQLGRSINIESGMREEFVFFMPEEFEPRLTRQEVETLPSLVEGLLIHVRVVHAVMWRQMLARFGQNRLGYLWSLLQPLAVLITLAIVFHVMDRAIPVGTTTETVLITGIVPVLVFFMRGKQEAMGSIRSNRNLLYFRQVTPYSLIFGVSLLHFFTALTLFLLLCGGVYLYGQEVSVENPLTVFLSLVTVSLLAMVFGGIFGIAALAVPDVGNFSQLFNRAIFFTSGVFFWGSELPPNLRDILLYNPIFHCVELMRDGFFVSYDAQYANWHYPLSFVFFGSLIMFSLERYVRQLRPAV